MAAQRRVTDAQDGTDASKGLDEFDLLDESRGVGVVFQPIVELSSGDVVGYEALARTPDGSSIAAPEALFAESYRRGRVGELDWVPGRSIPGRVGQACPGTASSTTSPTRASTTSSRRGVMRSTRSRIGSTCRASRSAGRHARSTSVTSTRLR